MTPEQQPAAPPARPNPAPSATSQGFKAGFGAVFGIIAAIVAIILIVSAINYKSPEQRWQDCINQQFQQGNVATADQVCGPHP